MLKAISAIGLALACTSCATSQTSFNPLQFSKVQPMDQLASSSSGVWASDGYGYILDTQDDLRVYNVTSKSCIAIKEDEENPLDYFDIFRVNTSQSALRFSSAYEPFEIEFNAIAQLPQMCREEPSYAILDMFDIFASYYETHYAFFDVHGVNWPEATSQMRLELEDADSEGPLIEAIIGLISQLKDGHVSVSATVDGDEGQFIAFPGRTMEAIQETATGEGSPMAAFGQQYLRADIEQAILNNQGANTMNERIKYGITSDDIGYMAVMSEGGFVKGGDASFEDEFAAVQTGMAKVITKFNQAGVKAVIIDLSVNQGGYDFLGRAIASSFTKTRVPAYTKYAYGASDKTPYQLYIEPSKGPKYLGPLYVMTSDVTVSAGETLTIGLRSLPNTTHVGATTRGAFSDVLTKYLPNGWEVTMSNEVYADHQGVVWEGKGVTPEIEYVVFDPKAPLDGHMKAINQLIIHIDAHH